MSTVRPILTITGSDSTGGSGVQADIKIISALGGYAVSAITCITVQNTLGIQEFYDIPAVVVSAQIEAVVNDVEPGVVKVGMIRSVEMLDVIVNALTKYRPGYVIYDPIVYSSNGEKLMEDDVVAQIQQRLVPLCSLVINQRLSAHGQHNMFSSAIAAYLSKGVPMEEAINEAKGYVNSQLSRQEGLQGRASELYHEFLDQVTEHFRTNNDVAFYADCLNVSSRYLAQVTRKISGKAPKNIIDEYVMNEIKQELRVSDKTVQEIAYHFGFSSQAHFAKFFKKLAGCTPSEFRKSK